MTATQVAAANGIIRSNRGMVQNIAAFQRTDGSQTNSNQDSLTMGTSNIVRRGIILPLPPTKFNMRSARTKCIISLISEDQPRCRVFPTCLRRARHPSITVPPHRRTSHP